MHRSVPVQPIHHKMNGRVGGIPDIEEDFRLKFYVLSLLLFFLLRNKIMESNVYPLFSVCTSSSQL